MSEHREVTITLNEAQVARVIQQASSTPELGSLLADLGDIKALIPPASGPPDPKLSRVLLQALRVLVVFPPDGADLALTDVARKLAIAPSSTHRYLTTWAAVGLLEQDPRSRRYRRVRPSRTVNGNAH